MDESADLEQDIEKLCNQSLVCIYGYSLPINYVSTYRFDDNSAKELAAKWKARCPTIEAFVGYKTTRDCIDESIGFKHLYIGIRVRNGYTIPPTLMDDELLSEMKADLGDTKVEYVLVHPEDFVLGYHTFLCEE
jgi:hypothetical protein